MSAAHGGGSRSTPSALETAQELARRGLPVFPCGPDKAPFIKGGFKSASRNPNHIANWWWQWPDALIGVPTGIRFDVLDIDSAKHPEAFGWMTGAWLPPTRWHSTRSGGYHFLFKPDRLITNSTSRIHKGVDTRGRGGYIIFWPAHGLAVENEDLLAEWPGWILQIFERPSPSPRAPRKGNLKQILSGARVDSLIRFVLTAPHGEMNNRLYWAGRRLHEMVAEGSLDEDYAVDVLTEAGSLIDLDPKRVASTVRSAFQGGAR
jgi:hypothetical protein